MKAGGAGSTEDMEATTLDVGTLVRSRLGKKSSSDNAPESSSSSGVGCNACSGSLLTAGAGDAMSDFSIDVFGMNMLSSISSERALASSDDVLPSS